MFLHLERSTCFVIILTHTNSIVIFHTYLNQYEIGRNRLVENLRESNSKKNVPLTKKNFFLH